MKPHRANLILVLGVLGLILCGPFTAIPAWLMASNDLKEMDAGTMDARGRGLTQTGRIVGIVGTILGILSIPALIAILVVLFRAAAGQ